MSVKLDIVPSSRSIDMFGTVHTSTAYSLSGHVIITITPHTSFFTGNIIRPPSIRLKSLSVVFEGKAESISPVLGYEATRLCRVEQNVVGGANLSSSPDGGSVAPSLTLNCAGGHPSETCWQWTVLFDLSIPGWLPQSLHIPEYTETSYSLHAFATVETLDPPSPFPLSSTAPAAPASSSSPVPSLQRRPPGWKAGSSWSLGSLSSFLSAPFSRPKERELKAEPIIITVNRLHTPPRLVATEISSPPPFSLFPMVHEDGAPFVLQDDIDEANGIPFDLLRGAEVLVSYPERIDVEEGAIPLGVRVRGMPEVLKGRSLRLTEFEVQVYQVETMRSVTDRSFVQQFPVPSQSEQPPNLPLLHPHPVQDLAQNHLFPVAGSLNTKGQCATKGQRRHPMMPDGLAYFRPSGASLGGVALDHRWARMDVSVPVLRARRTSPGESKDAHAEVEEEDGKEDLAPERRADRAHRRGLVLPTSHSPFAGVTHEMHIFLHMSWDPKEDSDVQGGSVEAQDGGRTDVIRCVIDINYTCIPDEMRIRNQRSPSSCSSLPPTPMLTDTPIPSPASSTTSFSSGSSLFPPLSPTASILSSLPSSPTPPPAVLPAYTQLFHENGELREYDADQYGCWLPTYSASEAEAAATKSPLPIDSPLGPRAVPIPIH